MLMNPYTGSLMIFFLFVRYATPCLLKVQKYEFVSIALK